MKHVVKNNTVICLKKNSYNVPMRGSFVIFTTTGMLNDFVYTKLKHFLLTISNTCLTSGYFRF